jgi:hypothetical protein
MLETIESKHENVPTKGKKAKSKSYNPRVCTGVDLRPATPEDIKKGVKCRCCVTAQRLISQRDDGPTNSKGEQRESHNYANLGTSRVPDAVVETSMFCDGCGIILCLVCSTMTEFRHPQVGKMKDGLEMNDVKPFPTWRVFKASRIVAREESPS